MALTMAARGLGRIPEQYLDGVRPLTGLLIGANLGAVVVAFAAGAAGVVALGRAKSGALVGVLVSITTIPSAANVGVALAMGNGSEALRSFTLLIVNLLGLLVGGLLTLVLTRAWRDGWRGTRALPPQVGSRDLSDLRRLRRPQIRGIIPLV